MPKDTFFRLSKEKQQRVLDAAREEFLYYKDNYDKASVKRIAEKADIAIGSIYKYFYDKNDLFFQVFSQLKKTPDIKGDAETLYSYSCEELNIETDMADPAYPFIDIIYKNNTLLHSLIFRVSALDEHNQRIRACLDRDRQSQLLRDGIDEELAAYMYSALEYIAIQYCQNHGMGPDQSSDILSKLSEIFFFGIYKDAVQGN